AIALDPASEGAHVTSAASSATRELYIPPFPRLPSGSQPRDPARARTGDLTSAYAAIARTVQPFRQRRTRPPVAPLSALVAQSGGAQRDRLDCCVPFRLWTALGDPPCNRG